MGRYGFTKPLLFVLIILFLVLVLLYVYMVLPKQQELASLQDELDTKRDTVQQLQAQLASLKVTGPGERALLAQVRAQIPEAPYDELLLRDLRKLEVISGLSFNTYAYTIGGDVSAISDEWSGQLVPIVYHATVEGDYRQIERLLREIETEQRIMIVEQINFSFDTVMPVARNRPSNDLTANLAIKSFFAPGLASIFDEPLPIDYEQPGGHRNPFD